MCICNIPLARRPWIATVLFVAGWWGVPAILVAQVANNPLKEAVPVRWDRAVGIQSPNLEKANNINFATGFLVRRDEQIYLVSAKHAANETHQDSRLVYRSLNGKSLWVSFKLLFRENNDPWQPYRNSDLSIALIDRTEKNKKEYEQLASIAIPFSALSESVPSRATSIEQTGFPLGLGATEIIRPSVVLGHVVTVELVGKNKWGTEPLFYCSPDFAQGMSGGPTFTRLQDERDVEVVGMYIGVLSDTSGGKLSKIVPSRVIREAILGHP